MTTSGAATAAQTALVDRLVSFMAGRSTRGGPAEHEGILAMDVLTPLELTTRNAAALLAIAREPSDDHAARQAARHARLLDAQFRLLTADGPPDYSGFREPYGNPRGPILGIVRPSWHELAFAVSATIHAAVLLAADCDIGNVETHWGAVRARLAGLAPFNADELVAGMQNEAAATPSGAAKPDSVLSEREQEALDFIRDNGPVDGNEIARHLGVDPDTVYGHYIPNLKRECGVKNKRSRGYYLPGHVHGD